MEDQVRMEKHVDYSYSYLQNYKKSCKKLGEIHSQILSSSHQKIINFLFPMISKKSSTKKPKKVNILTYQELGMANQTLDLHEDQELHKMVPSLKKFQSSGITDHKNNISINDEAVFQMFFQFLDRIVDDSAFCQELLRAVEFQELSKGEIPQARSFKQKVQNSAERAAEIAAERQYPRRLSKKISIFLDFSEQETSSSGSFYSENLFLTKHSIQNLGNIIIPNLKLSTQLIKSIFIAPSLFLMNLSLCLLLKYCYYTSTVLTKENVGWILSISAIIAYKIYYDQQIEDLMDCFQEIMKIEKKVIADLERNFLEGFDYRAIISGPQYQFVVAKMLQNEKENRDHK